MCTVMINRIKIPLKTLTELLLDFCHVFSPPLDTDSQYPREFLKLFEIKGAPF